METQYLGSLSFPCWTQHYFTFQHFYRFVLHYHYYIIQKNKEDRVRVFRVFNNPILKNCERTKGANKNKRWNILFSDFSVPLGCPYKDMTQENTPFDPAPRCCHTRPTTPTGERCTHIKGNSSQATSDKPSSIDDGYTDSIARSLRNRTAQKLSGSSPWTK